MIRLTVTVGILCCLTARGQTSEGQKDALRRLVHEADVFAARAPEFIGKESLQQTTLDVKNFAVGPKPGQLWPPVIKKLVVSEYGFLRLGPETVREMRQVLTVDGKAPKHQSKGLNSIALATQTSDKDRQKMLESFERNGLRGIATDFGPVLLIFAKGHTDRFEMLFNRMEKMDKIDAWVFRFAQIDGPGGMTIYEKGRPIKQRLAGELWVRATDYLPLRIILDSNHEGPKGEKMRDLSYVEYKTSEFGVLLPSRVVHQSWVEKRVDVEDVFTYSDYRRLPIPETAK
jgi:hypothetical protein